MKVVTALFISLSAIISVCLSDNAFYINSVSDFIAFSVKVSKGNSYSLTTVYLNSSLDFNGVEPFNPIGKKEDDNYFNGIFDGQGHVIYNLTINSPELYVGLFGYTKDSIIKNVILDESCTITSNSADSKYIGSICGYCEGKCTFENNINRGSVTYTGNADSHVGGIVGFCGSESTSSTLINNVNYGIITYNGAEEVKIGGIVGKVVGNTYVQGCMNFGTIYGTFSTQEVRIGGIIGIFKDGNDCTIMNSVNYGSIFIEGSAGETKVGGIIGRANTNSFVAQKCYNFGSIHSSCTFSSTSYIGGIVGQGKDKNNFTECVSDGAIDSTGGNEIIGPIYAGINSEAIKTISNCYYNEAICNGLPTCTGSELSSSYNEANSSSVLSTLASANNVILNKNGATLTLKVNCEVIATLSSKMIILPSSSTSSTSSQWYTNSECTNAFSLSEITQNTTLYQRIGSYSGICDTPSPQSSSSPMSSSSSFSSTLSSSSSPSSSFTTAAVTTSLSSSSLSSSSTSSSPAVAPSEYVKITFSKKDLTDDDVELIIKSFTSDYNYTIEEIKVEDGRLVAIIKFEDVETATSFVESISVDDYDNIEGISYALMISVSFVTFVTISKSFMCSLLVLSLFLKYITFTLF